MKYHTDPEEYWARRKRNTALKQSIALVLISIPFLILAIRFILHCLAL